MKPHFLVSCLFLAAASAFAGERDAWRFVQEIDVSATGWGRLAVPAETLDVARPDLGDLRLISPDGREVAYRIDRPEAFSERWRRVESPETAVEAGVTRITAPVPSGAWIDAVRLEAAVDFFLKPATLEGTEDGVSWRRLAAARPLFRAEGGESREISFPPARFKSLRLTLDDRRENPVPVTGLSLHETVPAAVGGAWAPVAILARREDGHLTVLTARLPGRNRWVRSLRWSLDEKVFHRKVGLSVRRLRDGEIVPSSLAEGTLHRLKTAAVSDEKLVLRVDAPIPEAEVEIVIQNGDSPPLGRLEIAADIMPTVLLAAADQAGTYRLYAGHPAAPVPVYDVAFLAKKGIEAPLWKAQARDRRENPSHVPQDPFPLFPERGAALDASGWAWRFPVQVAAPGLQFVELSPDVQALSSNRLADLRLLDGDLQVPYILDRTERWRSWPLPAAPEMRREGDKTFWTLTLPRPGWPLRAVTATAPEALFDRAARVIEMRPDDRGEPREHTLGAARWRRADAARAGAMVEVFLGQVPAGDKITLEVVDGDNPPLALRDFTARGPAYQAVFKALAPGTRTLYVGNKNVSSPRYDAALVTDAVLAVDKTASVLGAPERNASSRKPWAWKGTGGKALYWAVLAAVAGLLLMVILKLLPAEAGEKK